MIKMIMSIFPQLWLQIGPTKIKRVSEIKFSGVVIDNIKKIPERKQVTEYIKEKRLPLS